MALMRGRLFAGALFAGALFGAQQAEPQKIFFEGGGVSHRYKNAKRIEIDESDVKHLAQQLQEDDVLLEIIMMFVTNIDAT